MSNDEENTSQPTTQALQEWMNDVTVRLQTIEKLCARINEKLDRELPDTSAWEICPSGQGRNTQHVTEMGGIISDSPDHLDVKSKQNGKSRESSKSRGSRGSRENKNDMKKYRDHESETLTPVELLDELAEPKDDETLEHDLPDQEEENEMKTGYDRSPVQTPSRRPSFGIRARDDISDDSDISDITPPLYNFPTHHTPKLSQYRDLRRASHGSYRGSHNSRSGSTSRPTSRPTSPRFVPMTREEEELFLREYA